MANKKLLSIIILSSNRFDLLSATVNSLLATMTYPFWEMIIYNHMGTAGDGWNALLERINGEYILNCEDDWIFIQKWDWVEKAIGILERHRNVGIVRLRMGESGKINGQKGVKIVEKIEGGYLIECSKSCFSLNPFVARKETLLKIGRARTGWGNNVCEKSLGLKYNELEFKTATLDNRRMGVCLHTGRGQAVRHRNMKLVRKQ